MTKTKQNPDEDLTSLPIDQYSRQKWAAIFIDSLRGDSKKLSILDVGGYKGKTALFHDKDDVTVCDLFDVHEPGYVKGDGRKLPFKDNEFDYAVTFDTYEHVPRGDRKSFVEELCRVAAQGVVLAAPFDDQTHTVSQAEKDLNQYHIQLYGKDHPWLKEHIEYKIPQQSELESLIEQAGHHYTVLSSNDLTAWMVVQSIYFSIDLDDDLRGRVDDINRFYNKHLTYLDIPSDISYRKVYFISQDKVAVDKIADFISKLDVPQRAKKEEFFALALSIFGKKYRDVENYKNYLEKELESALETVKDFERKNQDLQEQLNQPLLKRVRKKFRNS